MEPPLIGFLAFSGLLVVIIGFNLGLLVGLFYFPLQIGLYILVPYYTYILFIDPAELRDGRRWRWFSRQFFPFPVCRRFLQMQLVVPDSLKKANQQYIFAVFPHGSNSDFRILLDGMLDDALPGTSTRTLAATVLFRIPLVRELALWTGCVDARKRVAERLLRAKDRSILVLPGGQAEQMRTQYGRETIYLQKRKGFLKLAMKHGVPVVPVYVFGVSDYYQTSNFGMGTRLWLLKHMGISVPIAWGKYGSTLCPNNVATTVVFGDPLQLPVKTDGDPSTEELDKAHAIFMSAIKNLFDSHKKSLGYESRELEIL